MLNVKITERGFTLIDFDDYNGVRCSLQESSLADADAIWLGCNEAKPRQLIPGKGWVEIPLPEGHIANTRMHLTREQVAELLPHLQKFAETGDL